MGSCPGIGFSSIIQAPRPSVAFWNFKAVAEPPPGSYVEARPQRSLHFLTQSQYVRVHFFGACMNLTTPRLLNELVTAQHPIVIGHKCVQERELAWRQVQRGSVYGDPPPPQI